MAIGAPEVAQVARLVEPDQDVVHAQPEAQQHEPAPGHNPHLRAQNGQIRAPQPIDALPGLPCFLSYAGGGGHQRYTVLRY